MLLIWVIEKQKQEQGQGQKHGQGYIKEMNIASHI